MIKLRSIPDGTRFKLFEDSNLVYRKTSAIEYVAERSGTKWFLYADMKGFPL